MESAFPKAPQDVINNDTNTPSIAETSNVTAISDGSGITYYRTWKVKIYDGSYAYGVEFTLDKGKHWFVGKSFSSKVEADLYLMDTLHANVNNKHWDDR